MKKNKQFILLSFTFLFLFFGMYLFAFFYQLGTLDKASSWIKDTYQYKDYIGSSIKDKKIIIASGSNGLFGINSKTIEEKTGYKVLNLAVHADLDMNFLYYKIKAHVKEGDIVVLPLELRTYNREKMTDTFINYILASGQDDYISRLPFFELMLFIKDIPKERIYYRVLTKFRDKENQVFVTQEEVLQRLNKILSTERSHWKGYSFQSLNKYGDINVEKPPEDKFLKVYEKGITYIDNQPISEHFLMVYFKIAKMVQEKQAKLILTWPVTVRNKSFDLTKNKHQQTANTLKKKLKEQNIEIKCNPALFHLDIKYFFNTMYHPNQLGAIIRSENLAECILQVTKYPEYEQMSTNEAIQLVRKQEEEYASMLLTFNQGSESNFKKRIVDLRKIKHALEKYYDAKGYYPKSKGFDGLYTAWGSSGKEWIDGLVPKYLKALPRDPRLNSNPKEQYLYRSNGKEYKLIAHGVEDCKSGKQINPKLIDLKRDCWAYGYWTKGAENW